MKHRNTSAFCGVAFIRRNPRPNASPKDSFRRGSSGRAFGKSVLIALLLGVSFASWAQIITTIAGNGSGGYNGDNIQATVSELSSPWGIAVDAYGNIYIADDGNNRIRKVTASGIISTLAGNGSEGYNGDNIQATAAGLDNPEGVAVDASGNVYIADYVNMRVRIVSTSGSIRTFAGNGTAGYSGDGGPATSAQLCDPAGVAADASGNVYIADHCNQCVRIVNTSGIISTFAGNGTAAYSGDGGPATAAQLSGPFCVAVDASGNVYIADYANQRIRKVNISGTISTIAGNGKASYSGDGGIATAAELNYPFGIAVDASGNVYIGDFDNQRVRMVNTSGIISTIAGNGKASYSGDGGIATIAELHSPHGVAVSISGNVYITDFDNERIREVIAAAFNVSGSATANVSCNGTSTGSASVISYHGTSPYTYSWSPAGGTNSIATGLSAGTYTITVTDYGDSTASAMVIITQPNTLSTITSVTTNIHCNGESNGNASANPLGGTSPYTYSWSNGSTSGSTGAVLSAGIYTVTVQDNCGASATAIATITQPNALSSTAFVTANVSCNGGNNGNASVTPSSGSSPYTYSWSNGSTSNPTGTVLSAGIYTVIVQDNCGASATASVTITQPPGMTFLHDSVAATLGCNGIAAATPSGGTSPYTYSWTFGQTADTIKQLCANTYCCTVTDNSGCSQTTCVTVKSSTGIQSLSNSSSISIYPDPNTGYFTVTGITQGQIIELYNYMGQEVVCQLACNTTIHFDISAKANGIYLLRMVNKDGSVVTQKKILKTQ